PAHVPPLAGRIASPGEMVRDMRLWALVIGNILVMTVYSLWTNWTTIFLVKQFQLTQLAANQRYAWIPPVCATMGGLFGGWLSMRWIKGGVAVLQARSRVILAGSLIVLLTAAVPYMPDAATATAMVSLSFFFTVAVSANVYALPQDLFGAERTAFAAAAITFGYGLMLVFYSPLVGRLVDRYDFVPVCQLSACLPLLGWLALRVAIFRP